MIWGWVGVEKTDSRFVLVVAGALRIEPNLECMVLIGLDLVIPVVHRCASCGAPG